MLLYKLCNRKEPLKETFLRFLLLFLRLEVQFYVRHTNKRTNFLL